MPRQSHDSRTQSRRWLLGDTITAWRKSGSWRKMRLGLRCARGGQSRRLGRSNSNHFDHSENERPPPIHSRPNMSLNLPPKRMAIVRTYPCRHHTIDVCSCSSLRSLAATGRNSPNKTARSSLVSSISSAFCSRRAVPLKG